MPLVIRAGDPTDDEEALVDLLLRCQVSRPMDQWPTAHELRLLIRSSTTAHAPLATCVAANGRQVGFAQLSEIGAAAHLLVVAEPSFNSLVERAILEWALKHQKERVLVSEETVKLYTRAIETDTSLVAVLEELGFAREDWYTARLERSLAETIPEPVLPEGFSIRPLAGELEAEAYVALHQAAFGTAVMTVAQRLEYMWSPGYVPELDLVAVSPKGVLAAFVVGTVDGEEMRCLGRKRGWTDPIGTRPRYQRRGLARALLLTAFQKLKARGISTVMTGTGSWNVPMLQLADSVGFRLAHRVLTYTTSV